MNLSSLIFHCACCTCGFLKVKQLVTVGSSYKLLLFLIHFLKINHKPNSSYTLNEHILYLSILLCWSSLSLMEVCSIGAPSNVASKELMH